MIRCLYSCFCALFVCLTFLQCASTEKIAYLQHTEHFSKDSSFADLYDAHIKPKDLLTITVNTFDRDISLPFNLLVPSYSSNNQNLTSQPVLQSYLVDNDGFIDFPVLGKIQVAGLTKNQVEGILKEKLKVYLTEEPLVNVRFVNYKISVLGEVNKPNTFIVANEKINILEALALAGDLTIYGKRENVKLVREHADGKKEIAEINLNDSRLVQSPYFYLQQNDVLYIEPNKAKARNASYSTTTGLWLSAASVLIGVASLLVNILR